MATIDLIQNRYCLGSKSAVGDPNRKYEDRAWKGLIETKSGLSLVVGMVADGVGSADFGANAAQIAIDTAVASIQASEKTAVLELILDAFHAANAAVFQENERSNGDGLTTLVLSIVHEGRCYIGNVGDSRAYWIQSSKKMLQLTLDHTYYNLYGGDPNSSEANILINAIGKKKNVEVDLALYLAGPTDRSTAIKLGKAGLPLEPGDTILLCSDGQIKNSPEGKPYTRPEELIDAATTEFGDKAAVKMVGYAEGRKVDDNVSAVVIQYLNKDRISQMESAVKQRKVKALALRASFGGLVLVLLITLGIVLARGPKEVTTTVTLLITNTPVPTLTPTLPVDPGVARVDEVNGGQAAYIQTDTGEQTPIIPGTTFTPGAHIIAQDAGLRIVVGELDGGTVVIYVFPGSDVIVNFGDRVDVNITFGSVFVQPAFRKALVTLPNHGNAVASIEGSKMIVQTTPDSVVIWCFEGECQLKRSNGDAFTTQVGQKRTYFHATDTYEDGLEMMYDEEWDWNVRCNYCLRDVVPTPTPSPTIEPSPTFSKKNQATATESPDNGGDEPSKTTQPPAPPKTTEPPAPPKTTEPPPPATTEPPPPATTEPPPPSTTEPPPPATTEPPPPPTTEPPPPPTTEPPPPPTTEPPPPPPAAECSDGVDNDNDTRIDSDDPGCDRPDDNDESQECNDGKDNDGDGDIDMDDHGCKNILDNNELVRITGLVKTNILSRRFVIITYYIN